MKVLFKPFQQFFQLQSASGLLLVGATMLALLWANSPFQAFYEQLWHIPLTVGFGVLKFSQPLHFWINEGLMTLFFLIVGLEIKRELWVGELSTRKKAALPFLAAMGGMAIPAMVYLAVTATTPGVGLGWGIPTVTDIAFALGILALLGNRVPLGLKVFLTALAIVDDLGAILLIALFYSSGLQIPYLLLSVMVLISLYTLNRMEVDEPLPYFALGLLLWFCILKSGLHATLAGVLLAFAIPSRSRIKPTEFYESGLNTLERFRRAGIEDGQISILANAEHEASVQELENLCNQVQSPLQQIEHGLHPWVSYFILPLFAFANAGVKIPIAGGLGQILTPISLAIILGLFFGKQLGITVSSWLAVKLGLAELPENVSWPMIYGASILGGIGFTMSIFIALLAFQQPEHVESAKLGILIASLISGSVGTAVLWNIVRHVKQN